MRKTLLLLLLVVGCRKVHVEAKPDDKRSGPPRVTCALPQPIAAATIPARCDLTIDKVVEVTAGASLEIAAGARITFAKGAGLVLTGGVLRARGTAEEPIVFTSAARAPGDWTGLVFTHRPFDKSRRFAKASSDAGADAADLPPDGESIVEHVVVEYGGARAEAVPKYHRGTAGVYVNPLIGDTVSLAHVKIRNSAGDALFIESPLSVTRLEAIDHDGVAAVPTHFATALAANSVGALRLNGTVDKSMTLPKRTYIVDGHIGVSAKAPATFEIEKGSTVKLTRGSSVYINGHGVLARLIARDVLFTSAEPTPVAGDWHGLSFSGQSGGEIDGCIFEFAGTSSKSSAGVIRPPSDEKKLKVTNSTFRNNRVAAFEAWSDCKPWENPALKNTSIGQRLCEESPLIKSIGAISALGVLGTTSSASLLTTKGGFGDLENSLGAASIAAGPGYGGLGGGGGGGIVKLEPPASKVVESSITATGALPVDVVKKSVRAATASLRSCHAGKGSGTITVTFTISASGSVTSAKASGGSLTSAEVRACVEGVFRGMSFPAGEGNTTATATHDYS